MSATQQRSTPTDVLTRLFAGWAASEPDLDAREAVRALKRAGFKIVDIRPGLPPVDDPEPDDLLYRAWVLIANARDWLLADGQTEFIFDGEVVLTEQQPDSQAIQWREAAIHWRDAWHATLSDA